MDDSQPTEDLAALALETPSPATFIPPSINRAALLAGDSYTYLSPIPPSLLPAPDSPKGTLGPPCALGVDEAGRGPVLGPMVYGIFFLPIPQSDPLLRGAHGFDDSKALTPAARAALVRALCTPGSDLHAACGWGVTALSARDVSAGMLRPSAAAAAAYNLNAQAFDATVSLVRRARAAGVNVREIFVDTVGPPAAYQARLAREFPTAKVTVAKKADSLYPCVSAASVCAKVTRDVALEVLWGESKARRKGGRKRKKREGEEGEEKEVEVKVGKEEKEKKEEKEEDDGEMEEEEDEEETMAWGSGYPSDRRCVSWMKANMHPVFGWGPECRFSWGTAKDMLEAPPSKGGGVKVDWPVDDDGDTHRVTDYFAAAKDQDQDADELGSWFGTPAGVEAF